MAKQKLGELVWELHLNGVSAQTNAYMHNVSVDRVAELVAEYEAQSLLAAETESLKRKWRERNELWYNRLNTAYMAGAVEIDKAIGCYDKLATRGAKLDGLDSAVKLDIQAHSRLDAELEKLLGELGDQEDSPL